MGSRTYSTVGTRLDDPVILDMLGPLGYCYFGTVARI